MLNLWIGLADGTAGLPQDLRVLGYRNAGIEAVFQNQDGDAVNPELLLASEDEEHTLVLEWKSGANTEDDQLRRYARISSSDLRERAYVPQRATAKHDVTLVGQAEHEDRLSIGLDNGGHAFPLIVADEAGLVLKKNDFRRPSLNGVFRPRLAIDWSRTPSSYVPVGPESELWEVASVVIPKVVSQMTIGAPSAYVTQIAEHVCHLTWKQMGTPAKKGLKAKVSECLEDAAAHEFASVWRWASGGQGKVEILQPLADEDQNARTRTLNSLRNKTSQLVARLQTSAAQPQLFPTP